MAVLLLTKLVSFRSKCEVVTLCTLPPTKRKDCLRATDHVPTGRVTQRSITLAYNGSHLPHSRTYTATSRKAEHEQRVKARVKSPCRTILLRMRMVRWCIRLMRLTLVCEVIRYRLVQVRQNLKKKRLFELAARNHLFVFHSLLRLISFLSQYKKLNRFLTYVSSFSMRGHLIDWWLPMSTTG